MCNIIGFKEKFAIQYKITEIANQFVYGHICYWINGLQIGSLDSETILSDVFIFLPQIIKDSGKRDNEFFFKIEKEKVFYLLGGQAYLDDEKYEEQATEEMWSRFNIKIGLDVFGDTMVKLVDYLDKSRIIFVDNNNLLCEFYLEKGTVDEIFLGFYNKFNELYKELVI